MWMQPTLPIFLSFGSLSNGGTINGAQETLRCQGMFQMPLFTHLSCYSLFFLSKVLEGLQPWMLLWIFVSSSSLDVFILEVSPIEASSLSVCLCHPSSLTPLFLLGPPVPSLLTLIKLLSLSPRDTFLSFIPRPVQPGLLSQKDLLCTPVYSADGTCFKPSIKPFLLGSSGRGRKLGPAGRPSHTLPLLHFALPFETRLFISTSFLPLTT